VETGTWVGEGVEEALQAGFNEIYSIELSPKWHKYCVEKFQSLPNVHLSQGDSGKVLEEVISQIDQPITFWLDAHYSGEPTAKGETNTPILNELNAIKKHPIKTHTILIDDTRCFGTDDFDYIKIHEALDILFQINPNYVITYRDGHKRNDTLVAYIPQ